MQPCSQPRYGLIERSKPMSGELLRAMIVRVASMLSRVCSGAGSGSAEPQPSSNATRSSLSKRPEALVTAPRPLRGGGMAGISMSQTYVADENITRTYHPLHHHPDAQRSG